MTEEKNHLKSEPEPGQPAEETGGAKPAVPGATQEPAPQATASSQNGEAYYKDLFLRKAAEFENYKKRIQQESLALARFATEDLLLSILPVVDDLERSLKSGKDHTDVEGFSRGIVLIYQKLLKLLESQGVKPFESLGRDFDVAYHDALLQVPRSDIPPHRVIEVVEPGYLLNDRVLRHAKVIVSSEAAQSGAQDDGADDSKPDQTQQKER